MPHAELHKRLEQAGVPVKEQPVADRVLSPVLPARQPAPLQPVLPKGSMHPASAAGRRERSATESWNRPASPSSPMSPTSPSSSPSSPRRMRSERFKRYIKTGEEYRDVLQAAQGQPWHVIYCREDDHRPTVLCSSETPAPEPLDVPDSAEAVIIMGDVFDYQAAKDLVCNLNGLGKQLPPVLVLLRRGHATVDAAAAVAAQQSLGSQGADDVLVPSQGHGPEEVLLAVKMSLERLQKHYWAMMQQQQRFDHLRERSDQMVWPCVHHVFEGFPKMVKGDLKLPRPGAQIGSLLVGAEISAGAFGEVFLATDQATGQPMALKAVPKTNLKNLHQVRCLWNEIRLLQTLSHPHIVGFGSAMHSQSHVYVAMEFAGQLNLFHVQKAAGGRLRVLEARALTLQIASAVQHLHRFEVAHRDIKPENVAIRDEEGQGVRATVVDFGCALRIGEPCFGAHGTLPFMAPEVLMGGRYEPAPSDVWSLGMLLLEMLCGLGRTSNLALTPDAASPRRHAEEGAKGTAARRLSELLEFFETEGALEGTLQRDLQQVPLRQLSKLMHGVLLLHPNMRWTADDVVQSQWLAEERRPGADGSAFILADPCCSVDNLEAEFLASG